MKFKHKILTTLMVVGITATSFIQGFADVNKVQIDLDQPSTGININTVINGKDTKFMLVL